MRGKRAIVTYDFIIDAIKDNSVLPFKGGEVEVIDVEGENICICPPVGYPKGYTFTINKCYLKFYKED